MRRLRHDRVAVVCGTVVLLLILAGLFADVINDLMKISGTQGGEYALDNVTATDFDDCPSSVRPWATSPGRTRSASRPAPPRTTWPGCCSDCVAAHRHHRHGRQHRGGRGHGLVSGFSRGWLDRVISFVTDLILSFPPFLLVASRGGVAILDERSATPTALAYGHYALIGSSLSSAGPLAR